MITRRGGIYLGIITAAILLLLQGSFCPQIPASALDSDGIAAKALTSAGPAAQPGGMPGSEFPIAENGDTTTTYESQFSIGGAFDGTNFLTGIENSVKTKSGCTNNEPYINAQMVSQSGEPGGGVISTGTTGGAPLVAFDGTNYLMVWEQDAQYSTGIFGQFITTGGTLSGSQFMVGSGTDMKFGFHSMLFDGTNYFVVWRDNATQGDDSTGNIYGQFVSPSGELVGSRITISSAPHGQKEPTLSFDGTNILAAWADGRNQSACYTDSRGTHCSQSDIYAQFVSKSSGSSAGTLDGTNFSVNLSSLPCDNPISADFSGTSYFIAFTQETTLPNACPGSGCKWNAYGRLVTPGNPPTIGPLITISATTSSHFFADVAWLGSVYAVTWTENFEQTSATINGRYFDKSGNPLDSEFTLFSRDSSGTIPLFAHLVPAGRSKYLAVVNTGKPGYGIDCSPGMGVRAAFVDATSQTGTLKVTIQPSSAGKGGAQWQADGSGAWYNSGASITLPVGPHTVSCKSIPGFDTPAVQNVTIVSGNNPLTVSYNPPAFNLPGSLGKTAECSPFSYQVAQPSGGTPPYAFSMGAGGSLPSGITIDPTSGLISGTATSSPAKYTFNVCVTDSYSSSAATVCKPSSITVTSPVEPGKPSGESPAAGAKNVATTVALNWNATSNTDSYDVYFGNSSPPPQVATGLATPGYTASSLSDGTTYNWKVVSNHKMCSGAPTASTAGPVWSFTTSKPAFTVPGSLGSVQQCGPFSYKAASSSGGTSPYTYSLSGNPPAGIPISTAGEITGQVTSAPGKYSLNVCVTDESTTTVCHPTSITVTAPAEPGKPSNSSPAEGAKGVATSQSLVWSASSNADSYDLYYGTSSPPGSVVSNVSSPYSLSSLNLNPSTTYYWQIAAKHDLCGGQSAENKGPVWSFSTAGASSVKGTAAAGSAIASTQVQLVDSAGKTAEATTGTDGSFNINSTGLTPPFLLKVTAGGGTTYFSVSADSNGSTTINITPLTDVIVRTWYSVQGTDAQTAFGDPQANPPPSPVAVQVIGSVVQSIVQPWLTAAGVNTSTFNPVSTPFEANGSGVDQVLDQTSVSVNASSIAVTISNSDTTQNSTVASAGGGAVTCSTTATTGNGTTSPVTTSTQVPTTTPQQTALNGINATINNFMNTVNSKGASLTAGDLAPYVAANFVNGGQSAAQWEDQVVEGMAGFNVSFSGIQVNSLDTTNNTADVTFTISMSKSGQTGSVAVETIFTLTGSSWLISGDGAIASAYAQTWAWDNTSGGGGYRQDLRFEVDDPKGVVTGATVTGPGVSPSPLTIPIVCGGSTGISCGNAYGNDAKNAFQYYLENGWPSTMPATYNFALTTSAGPKSYNWTVNAAFGFDSSGNPVPADYPVMSFTGGKPSLAQIMSGVTLHGSVYIPIWVNGHIEAPHFNYEGPGGNSNNVSNIDIDGTWDSGAAIQGQVNNFSITIPPAGNISSYTCQAGSGTCYNITFQGQSGQIQGGWFGEDACYGSTDSESTACTNSGIEVEQ